MPRPRPPADATADKPSWFGKLVGATLLGLVMAIGLLEMTKSPDQQQRERVQLKPQCRALREGLAPPPGRGDAESRRKLEESCRQLGLLPGG
jgi:hypothetical protein